MMPFLLPQTQQVQAQAPEIAVGVRMPPALDALIKAKEWNGLAEWFETQTPAVRGAYYEWWIQALNRTQRWDRLVAVCEALQPQIEAKTGPRLGTYRLYRAQALSQLQRHGEAAVAHAENGRLGYPDGFPNACAEARLGQDWPALLAHAGGLLAASPGDARGLAWKGEALARMDRFAEAEPLLREALGKQPKLPDAWNNLGRCLNERKAWAEAATALDQALALEPNQLEALFNRGRARFELRRYAGSRDDFKAALALEPDNLVLAENLRQAERYAALPTAAAKPKPKSR